MLSYTRNGLTVNQMYGFRYRVSNKFGWSSFSNIIYIRSATIPSQVSTPNMFVVYNTQVRVQWTAPYNGGNPILNYTVLFK